MDKLLALPIPGESFLLKRDGRNILVDGGYGSRSLSIALSAPEVAVDILDIVVCTHADKDHAGGLTDFLDKSPIKIKEFWLPGEWTDTLPILLQNPKLVVDTLINELDSIQDTNTVQEVSYEDFEARIHATLSIERKSVSVEHPRIARTIEPNQQNPEAGLVWLKRQAANTKLHDYESKKTVARIFYHAYRQVRYRRDNGLVHNYWASLWIDAIKTAERIRKIAIQAIYHNINVRWFDFHEFIKTRKASGGIPGLLIPLNAVELGEPCSGTTFARYIALLTPVNEQSLVFTSMSSRPWLYFDVVFTGDSPLGDGVGYQQSFLPPRDQHRIAIATAPHHGSENNSMAYKHLSAMTDVQLWLRTGGNSNQPGTTFKKIHPYRRACTHCHNNGYPRRLARVDLCLRYWRCFYKLPHLCCC